MALPVNIGDALRTTRIFVTMPSFPIFTCSTTSPLTRASCAKPVSAAGVFLHTNGFISLSETVTTLSKGVVTVACRTSCVHLPSAIANQRGTVVEAFTALPFRTNGANSQCFTASTAATARTGSPLSTSAVLTAPSSETEIFNRTCPIVLAVCAAVGYATGKIFHQR